MTAHRNTIAAAIGNGNRLAASLLSLDAPESYWSASPLDALAAAQAAKAGHITLAVVIGGFESSTGRNTWRNPGRDAFAYFTQIAAWGYPLSEVEQIVADATPAERPAPEPEGDDFPGDDEGDFED